MPDNGCSAEIKGQTAGNLSLSHWSDCHFPCLGKYKRVIGWGRGISPTVKPPLNYWRQACKVSVKIITTLFNYVLSSYVRQLRSEVEKQNSALIYDSHFFLARAGENGARELPEIRSGGGKKGEKNGGRRRRRFRNPFAPPGRDAAWHKSTLHIGYVVFVDRIYA